MCSIVSITRLPARKKLPQSQYILKECLQAVRWKRIYTLVNRSIVLVLVVAFSSPFRWQRSKIEIVDDDEDEHESERAKIQRPLVTIPKNFC
jgi:hypothetical protein